MSSSNNNNSSNSKRGRSRSPTDDDNNNNNNNNNGENENEEEYDDAIHDDTRKIFVSRIPSNFDEESIRRLIEESLGPDAVVHVALAYGKQEEGDEEGGGDKNKKKNQKEDDDRFHHRRGDDDEKAPRKKKGGGAKEDEEEAQERQHRGYGFVTLKSVELVARAADSIRTVRGGAKATSHRKHTLYLGRPVVPNRNDDDNNVESSSAEEQRAATTTKPPCFLFAKNGSCPYGDKCKFAHNGTGTVATTASADGRC